ncbi:hypothetical protein FUAX_22930 [Fulvitalea axinellae]|uniref:DUF3822 family protein n=1 Tax=Fulvitalea axinellae TaxID=1182444 RepID=A0AAU9CCF7_9BACT|nr:hypothetical protein FUAX_22930 [Fulvitalea axinellae]
MIEITGHIEYKVIKRVKDNERFEVNDLHHYDLAVQVGMRDMQVMATDSRTGRCLLLEDYVLNDHENLDQFLELLHKVYDEHYVLSAGFWNSVTVSGKSGMYSFVPKEHFMAELAPHYLQLSCEVDDSVHVLYNEHKDLGFVNVFGIPWALVDFFERSYPSKEIVYTHQSSSLVEGIAKSLGKIDDKRMSMFADRFYMHLIAFDGDRLLFYNRFPIQRFEDYVKYVNINSKHLGIDTVLGEMTLWGFISHKTPHYRQLQRFIPNLTLGDRPEGLSFCYEFDELEDNQYFDVFQLRNSS